MATYTFFLEYQGGTYISQVHARNHKEAPRLWVEQLDVSAIPNNKKGFREALIKSLEEFDLIVPLDGISRTWSCSFIYVEGVTVHFTQTVE